MKGECILYPCYFNTALERRSGRRVARVHAIKSPVLADLERALKRAGVKYRLEGHHHPAHWNRHEGRVVASWKGKKGELVRKVALALAGKR